MRIIFCAYREWALEIYNGIKSKKHNFLVIKDKKQLNLKRIKKFKPDFILFYGWSWKVGNEILGICPCVCLHPSALPKFRGGSPIQNQIIRGVTRSAVTLFKMSDEIDAGDIILQSELSLEGHLNDIFDRIVKEGTALTKKMLGKRFKLSPQVASKATIYKRRQPHESEININDFKNKTALELFNFIRALEDPYPNAFIRTKDKKKLLFKCVEIEALKNSCSKNNK